MKETTKVNRAIAEIEASLVLHALKEMVIALGYTITVDSDGTERVVRPDGSVAIIARKGKTAVGWRLSPND